MMYFSYSTVKFLTFFFDIEALLANPAVTAMRAYFRKFHWMCTSDKLVDFRMRVFGGEIVRNWTPFHRVTIHRCWVVFSLSTVDILPYWPRLMWNSVDLLVGKSACRTHSTPLLPSGHFTPRHRWVRWGPSSRFQSSYPSRKSVYEVLLALQVGESNPPPYPRSIWSSKVSRKCTRDPIWSKFIDRI